jgi:hypothetical protein
MSYYSQKYANMYAPALDAMRGLRGNPLADRAATEDANNKRMWGNIANMGLSLGGTAVGGLLGSLVAPGVGTAVGGSLGGALGGLAGSAASGALGGGSGGTAAPIGPSGPGGLSQSTLQGAGMGGQVGSALGHTASGMFSNSAEEGLDPIRQREMKRQALLELLSRGF